MVTPQDLEFTLIALARFQEKIAQTWDSDKKVCAIVLILCNSLCARVCLAYILDVKHEINYKWPNPNFIYDLILSILEP